MNDVDNTKYIATTAMLAGLQRSKSAPLLRDILKEVDSGGSLGPRFDGSSVAETFR